MDGRILITGGAGFLGRAIVKRALRDDWQAEFTIFSRDPVKHQEMRSRFPEANLSFVVGDVGDSRMVDSVVAGHDIVIHAAALKHVPEAERNPAECLRVNVDGSRNVAFSSITHHVNTVVGISTDKACHPVNVYGATKMMMERLFADLAIRAYHTHFRLVRYGNVLNSTASFIRQWKRMAAEQGKIIATDPDMTRFWLTDSQAVDVIEMAVDPDSEDGTVLIPRLPALSMQKMAEWVGGGTPIEYTGLRPGEKRHEELLTQEEAPFAEYFGSNHFGLWPVTGIPVHPENAAPLLGYSSAYPANFLTESELRQMLAEEP